VTKTLPKGHVSCLSSTFRYTPALHTDLAKTFARIKREPGGRSVQNLGRVSGIRIPLLESISKQAMT
jgi:hypothetical protein